MLRIPYNWKPRDYQDSVFKHLWLGGKRAIEIWHRRAGKDEVCLHWAALSAMRKPATYWHMLPQANQARKAIWDAVNPHTGKRRIDEAFPLEIRQTTRDQDMMIRFVNGSTWQVVGSDNFNSLVGSPPYGVVYSEWALANPQSWAYLRPIIRENGGWALFITTPRGDNHAKAMYEMALKSPKWHTEILTAEQTGVFSEEELQEELAEYIAQWGEEQGTALFEQEYLCSFEASMPGAYFGSELRKLRDNGHIKPIPYEKGIPVDTYWDLGIDDSMTIWFGQSLAGSHRFINYYENSNLGLNHYADYLYSKKIENKWIYGRHVAPHDIKVRELSDGKSRWEKARKFKEEGKAKMSIDFDIAIKPEKKEDAIEVMRGILPHCWFDEKKCRDGLNALKSFRKEWDEDKKKWGDRPVHDWSIHGADAFQTFAISYNIKGKVPDSKLKKAFG